MNWIPTEWQMEKRFNDTDDLDSITIHRMNSPFYDGTKYAVRYRGRCLNTGGKWEYEPLPSSRDDAFYKRCRFDSFEEAKDTYERSRQSPASSSPAPDS